MESIKKIFIINQNETIEKALQVITENHKGVVIIVDNDNKLMGVASDGDIRRGLVHGSTIHTPINKVMNINCVYLTVNDQAQAEAIMKDNLAINLIPIVNEKNQLVDIVIRK